MGTGIHEGIGIIKGKVEKFNHNMKIPQIGNAILNDLNPLGANEMYVSNNLSNFKNGLS